MVNDEDFIKTKKHAGKHDKENDNLKNKNKKDENIKKNVH